MRYEGGGTYDSRYMKDVTVMLWDECAYSMSDYKMSVAISDVSLSSLVYAAHDSRNTRETHDSRDTRHTRSRDT